MTFQNGTRRALDPLRLALLVEVGRRGTIGAAAEAVGIGQPSASKHLRALTAAVGQPLVERDGRASRLTAAGRVVAARGGEALAALDSLDVELDALRGSEQGRLIIAASPTAGAYVLPTVLRALAERHPAIELQVTIGSTDWVALCVERAEADLGVAGPAVSPSHLLAEPVAEDEVVAVAHPDLFRAPEELGVDELVAHTVLLREHGSMAREVAERAFELAGRGPALQWPMNSNEAIKHALMQKLGVAVLCRLAVADDLAAGRLAARRLPHALRTRASIVLLRSPKRELSGPARAFRELLTNAA